MHYRSLGQSGALDLSFNPGSGPNSIIWAMCLHTNGQTLIAGAFSTYDGMSANELVQINPDGSRDSTFDFGQGPNDLVHAIAVQADGRVIVGGSFSAINGLPRSRLARLRSDGSLDLAFPDPSVNNTVFSIALQPNGQMLIGGSFSGVRGTDRNRLARLNSDGGLDMSFNIGLGFDSDVKVLAVASGGKVLVGGSFNTFNGTNHTHIVRLNPDGSLDTSFDTGLVAPSSSQVSSICVQDDGKILVGGTFTRGADQLLIRY